MKLKILFEPLNYETKVESGATILETALQAGIHLENECGGKGRCGKCKIMVRKGVSPLSPLEREYLTPPEVRGSVRLACQTHVTASTSIQLMAIPSGKEHILEDGIYRHVSFKPAIRKYYLDIKPDDLKREETISAIVSGFLGQHGVARTTIDFSCMKALPDLLYRNTEGITAVASNSEVLGFELGDTSGDVYGLAVDIGTTTIVGYLFDLVKGQVSGVDSALNGQFVHGADVISRIDFALNEPDGLSRLQKEVADTINHIVEKLCRSAGIPPDRVYSLVVVGNTTMNHLFFGIPPRFLSRFPYNPLTKEVLNVPARQLGIIISPFGRVFSLPVVSGFIGSDTIGVVLSTGLHRSKEPRMAIDIGTNGEIVLTDGKRMVACSCAAGPAFEGAHIHCGMRGASGAIDRVSVSCDGVLCHVIGETQPKGICGSGLMDAIAGMLQAGLITGDGRLLNAEAVSNPALSRLIRHGKYNEFVLHEGCGSTDAREVVVTQKDIREVQLAKGAMMAGIRILMDRLGLREEDIREVFLAGAFGNYIRPESARAIGLLPILPKAKISQVGNAAGSGAKMALLSARAMREAIRIADRIEYVELAKIPHFEQEFIKGMGFPI